ncbi:response regulator transcription factor [Porphyromonadaceae bacterium OttesenSCG-928-L07]|nr:response regulator transcription factor [Porphyromonadaceae bacterium OttesenSCG-928-L07]MDL2252305.1 response regulator transcription factor [Odoribacter sp. OttesenSCG-928-J03]MDL2331171.1 response regulator transcription factor [Odoribacter sp. OttesenSCG-928-A06]
MAQKILLVEDDPCFGSVLKSYLELSDYEVTLCTNGKMGLEAFTKDKFDICLLDVMMPEMDGFTLGKKIREISSNVPFVYITAKGLKNDMRMGYEIGADDYIVKPFDSELLILKIKAIINRCEADSDDNKSKQKCIKIGDYEFNTELRTITKGEKVVRLTPKEGKLLEMLYNNKDGMLSREKALTEIWGSNDYFTARSMDVYITKLRKYFKEDKNITIDNIHGSGFRLIVEIE